jgi:phosphoribosyl-AMP cyclohydrolase / phosphoribosyl-ATP pyrophosphohydrolase
MQELKMNAQLDISKLKFDEKGLIPAIVQDQVSGKVLMLGYMNRESLLKTLETGKTWFYSRSRQKLWNKGESSGHFQTVHAISYDCDEDSLLVQVFQEGPACHTNSYSCFYRTLAGEQDAAVSHKDKVSVLREVYEVILERKKTKPENSYVAKKMEEGIDRILKKVGEEAGEVIIAGKNADAQELAWETADLIFHLWMALAFYDIPLDMVYDKLIERRK